VLTAAALGRALQSARRAAGLTQAQLGARVGLSQARLSALERQPGAFSFEQLLSICSSLGLELSIGPSDAGTTPDSDR